MEIKWCYSFLLIWLTENEALVVLYAKRSPDFEMEMLEKTGSKTIKKPSKSDFIIETRYIKNVSGFNIYEFFN
jgi:hypothetical protein